MKKISTLLLITSLISCEKNGYTGIKPWFPADERIVTKPTRGNKDGVLHIYPAYGTPPFRYRCTKGPFIDTVAWIRGEWIQEQNGRRYGHAFTGLDTGVHYIQVQDQSNVKSDVIAFEIKYQ